MKTKFFYFFIFISFCMLTQSCEKTTNCECNTPFVFGNYYQPGDIVSNRGACWTMGPGTMGAYFNYSGGEPRDSYPTTQDTWVKICEK